MVDKANDNGQIVFLISLIAVMLILPLFLYLMASMYFDMLVVQQENTINLIQHKRKYEVYAKNVGMIAKVYKDAEITNFDTTQVTKGFTQIMQIIDFGIE
jgi:hypothetical protein